MNHSFANQRRWTRSISGCAFLILFAVSVLSTIAGQQTPASLEPGTKPADVPAKWKPWIGEYGLSSTPAADDSVYLLSESDGVILLSIRYGQSDKAQYETVSKAAPRVVLPADKSNAFQLYLSASHERLLHVGKVEDRKITPDSDAPQQVLIKPVASIDQIRKEALKATPPEEKGPFRKPDLVELAPLDPAIHLEIRYATKNDFLGTAVYTQARAFMQRPAADALVRASKKLQALGYGLLIHDAYRPWYVTKIFWDATPPEGKIFVADPSQGSRHNRGCAVDLTLYDLASGKPIEMPGTYDEMSPRSFPDYPGGTSLQRWHRDLLRRAMESEGFAVYEHEWWHFDYKDWHEYPILNIKFEDLNSGQGLASAH
jgi:D-alanyl-D-alanine dipeptidase